MKTLKSNPMRYFYITYKYANGFGYFDYTNANYPNRKNLEDLKQKELGVSAIVITNIIEMTEEDALQFRAK